MLNASSIDTVIAAILEKSINVSLRYDPATQSKLRELEGHVIRIDCTAPAIKLGFSIQENTISVRPCHDDADVIIVGDVLDFLSLIGKSPHSLADSNVNISGKINVLNQLKCILSKLDIDWEEPLNEILGVLPGHTLAQAFRGSWSWLKQRRNEFDNNVADYLTEELKTTPSQRELQNFHQQIDELRSATQRIEAKVVRLKNITTPKSAR